MLSAVFEPFTQVDGTRGPANDGIGIGLRLVKAIVELHGGAVNATSGGLGYGSEFTVQLPVTNDGSRGNLQSTS
jgi:signal transduction histidine kinase